MKRIDFRDLQKYLHEIPGQPHGDEVLKRIHSMDAHTAYALLGGYLAPLLSTEKKHTTMPKLLHFEEVARAREELAPVNLRNLNSILPELEKEMERILKYLEVYLKHLPTDGWVDDMYVYRIDVSEEELKDIYLKFRDAHDLADTLIRKIKEQNIDSYTMHPELRKKYYELLQLLTTPDFTKVPYFKYLISPEQTKLFIRDIKKALEGLYENREERTAKDLENRIRELEEKKDAIIGDLQKQIGDLSKNEKTQEQRIATLEQSIKDLEGQKNQKIEDLEKQISELKKKQTENKTTIDDLKRQIEELKDKVSGLEKDKTGNKTIIDNLNRKIEELNGKVSGLEEEKNKNAGKVNELNEKITKLEKEKSAKDSEIAELREELTKEKNNLKKIIDDLNQQIEELKDKVSGLEKDKTGNKTTIDDLNRKIEELNGKVSGLEEEKNKNAGKVNELNEEITKLEKEKSAKDSEIAELREELTKEKNNLKKIMAEKETAIEKLNEELKGKKEEITALQQEILGLKKKIKDQNALEEKITDLQKQKDQLQKEKDKLEKTKTGEITDLQEKLNTLNERIKALEKARDLEINSLKESLKEVSEKLGNREFDELKDKVGDLRKDLESLEDMKGKNWEELQKKLKELEKNTGQERDLTKGIGDLPDEIKKLREEIEKTRKEGLEWKKTRDQINELRKKLNELEKSGGEFLEDLDTKLRELEQELRKEGDHGKKMKELNENIQKVLEEIKKENDKIIDKRNELEKKVREKEQELRETKDREKLEKREKELEDLQRELKEIRETKIAEIGKEDSVEKEYVHMIVVFLTLLRTQVERVLKRQGDTMKQVSELYGKWNAIQKNLNDLFANSKVALELIRNGHIDRQGNLISSRQKISPEHWNKIREIPVNLLKQLNEMENLLEKAWKNLPESSRSLIDMLQKLCDNLRVQLPEGKELEERFGTNEIAAKIASVTNELSSVEKEIKEMNELDDEFPGLIESHYDMFNRFLNKRTQLNKTLNELRNIVSVKNELSEVEKEIKRMEENGLMHWSSILLMDHKKLLDKRTELKKTLNELTNKEMGSDDFVGKRELFGLLTLMGDSDQSKFKSYMDNIGQGVTALTSISNAIQQELQINTQYYNSLLGLQKSGLDSLSKTIQSAIHNVRN